MIIKMELLPKNGTKFVYILFMYLNVSKINWLQPLTLKN